MLNAAVERRRGAKEEEAEAEEPKSTERNLLVYAARRDVSMRNLDKEDDADLVEALQAIAKEHGLEFWRFEAEKDANVGGVRHAIDVFKRAAIVVGVHGGALSNILFCQTDTLVVELGMKSPLLRHFEHAAVALGMYYSRVLLEDDEHGVGARTVKLPSDGVEQAEGIVFKYLDQMCESRGMYCQRAKDEL